MHSIRDLQNNKIRIVDLKYGINNLIGVWIEHLLNANLKLSTVVTILTSCSVLLGKREEFESVFNVIKDLYIKEGAKFIGFWWTLGGDANSCVWMYKWDTFTSYQQGKKGVHGNSAYPLNELSSIVISYNEKILEE